MAVPWALPCTLHHQGWLCCCWTLPPLLQRAHRRSIHSAPHPLPHAALRGASWDDQSGGSQMVPHVHLQHGDGRFAAMLP